MPSMPTLEPRNWTRTTFTSRHVSRYSRVSLQMACQIKLARRFHRMCIRKRISPRVLLVVRPVRNGPAVDMRKTRHLVLYRLL